MFDGNELCIDAPEKGGLDAQTGLRAYCTTSKTWLRNTLIHVCVMQHYFTFTVMVLHHAVRSANFCGLCSRNSHPRS
jgi:hypothetical protein